MGEEVKALVIEEIAKADASVAELLSVHTLSSDIINRHGTEAQKEKYLARACSGQVGAFALTEPGAGSDAAAAKTQTEVAGVLKFLGPNICRIRQIKPATLLVME